MQITQSKQGTFTHSVVDGNNARHDVNNPLRVDNHLVFEKFVVEMLNGSQLVQESYRLLHLGAENSGVMGL